MTNIVDQASFDPVYLIEVGDQVIGGAEGISNKQGIALANRTLYLKTRLEGLTPEEINAADVTHTHTSDEITDFDEAAKAVVVNSITAGSNVSLSLDSNTGNLKISATGGGNSGGSGFIIQDLPNSDANQNHIFYFTPQTSFDLQAFALKAIAGATNQIYNVDSFTAQSSSNYNSTSDITFTSGLGVFMGGTYTLALVNSFYEAAIKANGSTLNVTRSSASIVPSMSNETTPAGYVITAKSVYNSTYPAYTPFADNVGGSQSAWISSATPTAAAPQWIQVELPANKTVTDYTITNRRGGGIASPNTWTLMGSNDNSTWNTLHTVTNDTNVSAGAVRSFKVTTPGSYKYYRINITARNGSDSFVAIYHITLNSSNKVLLRDKNNNYYNAVNGTLTKVTTPTTGADIESTGFTDSGSIAESSYSGLVPLTAVSSGDGSVVTKSLPKTQLAIQKSFVDTNLWESIVSATITNSITDGNICLAVSKNNTEWFVWNTTNSTWTSIGSLTVDTTNANKVITGGMTPTVVNAITQAQWLQFIDPTKDTMLGFAYALTANSLTSVVNVTKTSLTVNESSSWQLQSPTEVLVNWRKGNVIFKPTTAGTYKFIYQIPTSA